MGHTKRSPEFLMQVRRLREKLVAGTLDAQERADLAHIVEFNTTDSGCMVKAAEDEPVFVLRGQDIDADKCVDHWCELRIEKSIGIDDSQFSEGRSSKPLTKIADARDCAREMREFRHRKEAD